MKELSIEEKAKAYDEALKYAMIYYKDGNEDMKMMMKTCFPVLVEESEDERIRKAIIHFISHTPTVPKGIIGKKTMLAWLEKQGNKDMGISNTTKQKLKDNLDNALEKETPESWNEFLEKQGEQKPAEEYNITGIGSKNAQGKLGEMIKNIKPVNEVLEQKPADKVEPKFEIGDLITNGILVGKIDEIHELGYHAYFGDHYADVPDVENWHKWTIQDAKDGDVLSWDDSKCIALFKNIYDEESFNSYGLVGHCTGTFELRQSYHDIEGAHPATKEQRDLLFKKMKEAGYEWDSEKKELKKIEQKQIINYPDNLPKDNWELIHEFVNKFGRIPKDEDELNVLIEYVLKRQKPAWSEEDDKILKSIIINIENLQFSEDMREKYHHILNTNKSYYQIKIDWLKSLKDRVIPQPKQEWSEEDKEFLELTLSNLAELKDRYGEEYGKVGECMDWLKYLRPQKQCCNDVPSREYILNVWELGNYWKELTKGVCSTEHGTQLEYIQNHWKEGEYYDKIIVCPQKHWKPSEEQLNALHWCVMNVGSTEHQVLQELLEQLEKLKD